MVTYRTIRLKVYEQVIPFSSLSKGQMFVLPFSLLADDMMYVYIKISERVGVSSTGAGNNFFAPDTEVCAVVTSGTVVCNRLDQRSRG